MPRPRKPHAARPTAQEVFTDRVAEQLRAKQLFEGLCAAHVDPRTLFLSFYGVGGVGKSTLKNRAIAQWRGAPHPTSTVELHFAECDVDATAFTPDYGIMEFFSRELRPALQKAGLPLPLFDTYYCAWRGKSKPDEQMSRESVLTGLLGMGERTADTATPLLGWLSTLGASIRGTDLALKAATAIRDWRRKHHLMESFPELELGEFSLKQFDEFAGDVMAADLRADLASNPGKALCIVIDGFERIQSNRPCNDLQHELQDFCQHLLLSEPTPRCGFLFLGREKICWRELYDGELADSEQHWDKFITHSLLGGIGSVDAREFLGRVVTWYRKPGAADDHRQTADLLEQHVEAILRQAEEDEPGGERYFHPYSLDLAVQQVIDNAADFRSEMLGRGSRDLQERFLRYMDDGRRSALQALAVALEFEQGLFAHLIDKRIIVDLPLHGFPDLVAATYVTEDSDKPGTYRFHRKMQEALLTNLMQQQTGRQKLAVIVEALEAIYRDQLTAALGNSRLLAEHAYDRAAAILTDHAKSGRLEFKTLQSAFNRLETGLDRQARDRYFNLRGRIGAMADLVALTEATFGAAHPRTAASLDTLAGLLHRAGDYIAAEPLYRRALAIREAVRGPHHPATAASLNNLAGLVSDQGDLSAAESLYRRALAINERSHGLDHSATTSSLNNLGAILFESGDYAAAEPLYRRALAIRERTLGSDHPDTAASLGNLAGLLARRKDFTGAEPLYRRALAIRERVLGSNHADTASTLYNLALLLAGRGDYSSAEPLFRRSLAIRELVVGPNHPATANSLHGLALLLRLRGDYAGAEPLSQRALMIREQALGPTHRSTVAARSTLARCLESMGRSVEAASLRQTQGPAETQDPSLTNSGAEGDGFETH